MMPVLSSALRIHKVFRKLAVPPAREAIRLFITMSFAEPWGILLEKGVKSFLSRRATETEEPTAAEYPKIRSEVV